MTTTTRGIPAQPFASVQYRKDAIRTALVGKPRNSDEVYTDEDIDTLLKSSVIEQIVQIDAALLEKADVSAGAEAAIARECEQFKMRLDYLVSALTIQVMRPSEGIGQRPWTLAVLGVRQVPKEFGQTLIVSTDVAAPLWKTKEQRSGDTKEVRSTFHCGLSNYTTAEDIGFFDETCEFEAPLLVQGFPTVLPNGQSSFTITRYALDVDQAAALKKKRKAAADAVVKAEKEALKAERAAKAAAKKATTKAKPKTPRKPRVTKAKVKVAAKV